MTRFIAISLLRTHVRLHRNPGSAAGGAELTKLERYVSCYRPPEPVDPRSAITFGWNARYIFANPGSARQVISRSSTPAIHPSTATGHHKPTWRIEAHRTTRQPAARAPSPSCQYAPCRRRPWRLESAAPRNQHSGGSRTGRAGNHGPRPIRGSS